MIPILRSEARKLTSTRSLLALALAPVAFVLVNLVMLATVPESQLPDFDSSSILNFIVSAGDIGRPVLLILGILGAAGEFRFGTLVPSLLANPNRGRFLAGKMVFHALLGVVVGLVSGTAGLIVGAAYLRSRDITVDLFSGRVLASLALLGAVTAIYGMIGIAIGLIVRNQTTAITGAVVWLLALEGALPIVLRSPEMRQWLPHSAGSRLLTLAYPEPGEFSTWSAVLVLGLAVTLASVAARTVFARVDVS